MYEYKSSLAPFFTSYVEFKRSLGYKLQDTSSFKNLDRFLCECSYGGSIGLSEEILSRWCACQGPSYSPVRGQEDSSRLIGICRCRGRAFPGARVPLGLEGSRSGDPRGDLSPATGALGLSSAWPKTPGFWSAPLFFGHDTVSLPGTWS